MNKRSKRVKWLKYKDNIVFGIIMFLSIFVGIRNINLPGVYFDSAITDYLAAFVVNPSALGEKTTISHVGLPLLGGIYHGSLSMFLQIPILKIFTASAVTLRVPYLIYYGIATFILYKIISKLTSWKIGFGTSIVWAMMIFGTTLSRTQYDIMLPGLFFFLLAIYIFISKWDIICSTFEGNRGKVEKYCFLTGVCMGMAFYGYFCFIFFVPVYIIFIWHLQKNDRFWTEIAFVTGIVAGSTLYFLGYADSLFTNVLGHEKAAVFALAAFGVIFAVVLGIPVWYFLMEKEKSRKLKEYYIWVCGVGILGAAAGMAVCIPLLKSKLEANGLNVLGSRVTLRDRLTLFFQWFYQLVTDSKCEKMINGNVTSIAPFVMLAVFVPAVIICLVKIRTQEKQKFLFMISFFITYYICSIPFISRMQPQHFVPLLFLIPVIIVMGLYELLLKEKRLGKILLVVLKIVFIGFSVNDQIRFHTLLKKEEGIESYSVRYNELAENALAEYKEEKKTVWLFAEPGFYPTFIYLTENNVPSDVLYGISGDEWQEDSIGYYTELGYDIRIVSRGTVEKTDRLSHSLMQKGNKSEVNIRIYADNSSNYLFSVIY